jgi:hypothetical protein
MGNQFKGMSVDEVVTSGINIANLELLGRQTTAQVATAKYMLWSVYAIAVSGMRLNNSHGESYQLKTTTYFCSLFGNDGLPMTRQAQTTSRFLVKTKASLRARTQSIDKSNISLPMHAFLASHCGLSATSDRPMSC